MDDRTTGSNAAKNAAKSPQVVVIDALLPADVAVRAEEVGVKKATTDAQTLFILSVLAGAFIAFGAIFATTVSAGGAALPYGVTRLLTGVTFSVGLILVIVGGAELFTGNNMIVMAWANGKVATRSLLLNWTIAFIGNFVGAFSTADSDVLHRAIHVWRRSRRPRCFVDGPCKDIFGTRSRADAGHHVQCACVPGGVDVLRRPHERRQGCNNRPADHGIRRRRIRA